MCDSPAQCVDEIARLGAKPLVRLADYLELLVDLAVCPLTLLFEQIHVRLDLLERLLQRLDVLAEPAHRLLGEGVRVLAEHLCRQRLDRVLDARVEGSALGGQCTFRLCQGALRFAGLERRTVAVDERAAHRDDVDAGGAEDEPDQKCDDGHEGISR